MEVWRLPEKINSIFQAVTKSRSLHRVLWTMREAGNRSLVETGTFYQLYRIFRNQIWSFQRCPFCVSVGWGSFFCGDTCMGLCGDYSMHCSTNRSMS